MKLISSKHWCFPWLIHLCTSDEQFFDHLIEQQFDFIHFLCLVHLYKNDTLKYNQLTNNDLARLIRTHSKKQILKELLNPYPSGITNILKKLNAKPYSKHTYYELISLLQDNDAGNQLHHTLSITPSNIKCIYELSHNWRNLKLLRHIKTPKEASTVLFIQRCCLKLGVNHPEFIDYTSLKKINNIDYLTSWFERRVNNIQFQKPPWNGNKQIRPIINGTQLIKESKTFKNCISDYLSEALLGTCCFYTSDYGPAIIKLNKVPIFDWHIDEILGHENNLLSKRILNKIYNEFSMHSIDKKLNIGFDQPILNMLSDSWR